METQEQRAKKHNEDDKPEKDVERLDFCNSVELVKVQTKGMSGPERKN